MLFLQALQVFLVSTVAIINVNLRYSNHLVHVHACVPHPSLAFDQQVILYFA